MLLDESEAKALAPSADVLGYCGFPMARFALLYNSGQAEAIVEDFTAAFEEDEKYMHNFFRSWKEKHRENLNSISIQGMKSDAGFLICTKAMGVRFVIECEQDFGLLCFATDLVGVLESLLAFAKWENLAFATEVVNIKVRRSSTGQTPPSPEFQIEDEEDVIVFVWDQEPAEWLATASPRETSELFMGACLGILLHSTIDPLEDIEGEIKGCLSEGVLRQTIDSTPTIRMVADLIGKDCYELECCVATASSEA